MKNLNKFLQCRQLNFWFHVFFLIFMLVYSWCWIFAVFSCFWLLLDFWCLCLASVCRNLLIFSCIFLLFLLLGLESLLAGIFWVFVLGVLDWLCILVLFLFVFSLGWLVGWNRFCSIGRCYIWWIWNICLIRWLFFFFQCNFLYLVCFSWYCSWFRFPSADCRVLWNLLLWSFYLIC